MKSLEERSADAAAYHKAGIERIKSYPEPSGQKFPRGSRVRIADDLGSEKAHFPSGTEATVEYTYAHAYGGSDNKSYSLDVDGSGSVAWYKEDQLTQVFGGKSIT